MKAQIWEHDFAGSGEFHSYGIMGNMEPWLQDLINILMCCIQYSLCTILASSMAALLPHASEVTAVPSLLLPCRRSLWDHCFILASCDTAHPPQATLSPLHQPNLRPLAWDSCFGEIPRACRASFKNLRTVGVDTAFRSTSDMNGAATATKVASNRLEE